MVRRITTLFAICGKVRLTQDPGQIPYYMHKLYGYDGRVASYRNSAYTNAEGEVRGLRLDFFENTGRLCFAEKGALKCLRAIAKTIDPLALHIFSKHLCAYGICYKLLNSGGLLFLKLVIHGSNRLFRQNFVWPGTVETLSEKFEK